MLIGMRSMEAGRDTPLEGKLGTPPGALRPVPRWTNQRLLLTVCLVALSVLDANGRQNGCQMNLQVFSTPCRKPVHLATHNFDFTPKSHLLSPLTLTLSLFGYFSLYRFALAVFVR